MPKPLAPLFPLSILECDKFERCRQAETTQAQHAALANLDRRQLRNIIVGVVEQYRLLPKQYKPKAPEQWQSGKGAADVRKGK